MASIKHLFHIAAPREEVCEAISSIEGMQNWWTAQTSGDSSIGGIIAFRFGQAGPDFKVTDLKENTDVTWECVQGFPDWVGTTITFHLDENEGKTRVRFSHDGWKETGDSYAATNFSWTRYLNSLRQYCQTGIGQAFGSATYVQ